VTFWCDAAPSSAPDTAAVERHLARVQDHLPGRVSDLVPGSDASDAVILHLWQAMQMVIDLAVSACLHLKLGTPSTFGNAFRWLADAGHLGP
jgi:hypothetical protein